MASWEKSYKKVFEHPRKRFAETTMYPHYEVLVKAISDKLEFVCPKAREGEGLILQVKHVDLEDERLLKIAEPRFNNEGLAINKRYRIDRVDKCSEYEYKTCGYGSVDMNNQEEMQALGNSFSDDIDAAVWERLRERKELTKTELPPIDNVERARFLRGAVLQNRMSTISFKNGFVPKVLEYGDKPFVYMIMEVVFGVASLEWFRRREYLDRVYMMAKIATFVHEINKRSVFHRDIKPGNILIANDQPALIDWALAINIRSVDDSFTTQFCTETGWKIGLGTPKYSHPDLLKDATKCKLRCDVYSLGLSMWSFFMDNEPSLGLNSLEIQNPELVEEAQRKAFNIDLLQDPDIRGIFFDCIDRSGRIAVAGDLAKALLAYHSRISPNTKKSTRRPPLIPPSRKTLINIESELEGVKPENKQLVKDMLKLMLRIQKGE